MKFKNGGVILTTAREKQTETPKHKLELIATIIIAGELKVLPTLPRSVKIELTRFRRNDRALLR